MVSTAFKTLALTCGLAAMTTSVHGHGYMLKPAVYFPTAVDWTGIAGDIDGYDAIPVPDGRSYSWDQLYNTESFTEAWYNQTEYTSLRDFFNRANFSWVDGATAECGFTDPTDQSEDLPEYVEWTKSSSEGFIHNGPCEVWCDDTRVFQNDNCEVNYPTAPAMLNYTRSECVGATKLTTVWMALHSYMWQAYVDCAGLSGNLASGSSSGSVAAVSTTTTSTAASASTTEASAASATAETTTTTTSSADSAVEDASASAEASTASSASTTTTTASSAASETTDSASASVAGEATDATTTTTTSDEASASSSKCNVRNRRRN